MSERVVPSFAAGTVPISGLPELQAHLEELTHDPSLPFDLRLLDDVELQLTGVFSSSSNYEYIPC